MPNPRGAMNLVTVCRQLGGRRRRGILIGPPPQLQSYLVVLRESIFSRIPGLRENICPFSRLALVNVSSVQGRES